MEKQNLQKVISSWKKQKTRLLVLTGKRKSGKDVAIEYIMKNYPGFRHYRFADGPDLIAKALGLPIERRTQHALFGVNKLLYPILGESAYKRRVARLVDRDQPRLAIVEAVRTQEEYNEFVVKRGGFLVGFTAHDKIRYKRALKDAKKKHRKQDEDKMTFHQFMLKEKFPLERKINWLLSKAHICIENNFSNSRPFYHLIDQIMRELGFNKKTK